MTCHIMLSCIMSCHIMLSCNMSCHIISYHVMLSCNMSCHIVLSCIMSCHIMLSHNSQIKSEHDLKGSLLLTSRLKNDQSIPSSFCLPWCLEKKWNTHILPNDSLMVIFTMVQSVKTTPNKQIQDYWRESTINFVPICKPTKKTRWAHNIFSHLQRDLVARNPTPKV